MIVKCQQQCIFKIRDGIPGHGPQKVLGQYRSVWGSMCVALACGCSIPIMWLPKVERVKL
jgi:hypothetical protein